MTMKKWALVTGATAGIGESFTRLLAANGFNIALVARDHERLLERSLFLQKTYSVETSIIQADLSLDSGCAILEEYLAKNEIEVLVNNAGFGIKYAFTTSALEAEEDLLKVLVRAPMRSMHIVLPKMKERNSGTIINVSSVASWIAGGTYSASKSYLTVLSESIHTELESTNIKVMALCPGFTHTEFHQRGKMKMSSLPEFMWLDADDVVKKAWSDSQAGKAISVPGWQYLLLSTFARFFPRPIVRKLGLNIRARQRR
jgi:short-subunit dehydrogenase